MNRRIMLPVCMISLLAVNVDLGLSAPQQSDDKKIVDSFKAYVGLYFDGYKANPRERVALLGGGWVREYYEPVTSSAAIDVQRTSSLVSPYSATLEFSLVRHTTNFHKSRAEAEADSTFIRIDPTTHRHTYAYQDGSWVPKMRRHRVQILNSTSWGDCDEVIPTGPDAGARNIFGCWEEV